MLTIQDFLLSHLGGTTFLWEVALGVTIGVVIGGIILSMMYFALYVLVHG